MVGEAGRAPQAEGHWSQNVEDEWSQPDKEGVLSTPCLGYVKRKGQKRETSVSIRLQWQICLHSFPNPPTCDASLQAELSRPLVLTAADHSREPYAEKST